MNDTSFANQEKRVVTLLESSKYNAKRRAARRSSWDPDRWATVEFEAGWAVLLGGVEAGVELWNSVARSVFSLRDRRRV